MDFKEERKAIQKGRKEFEKTIREHKERARAHDETISKLLAEPERIKFWTRND